MLHSDEGQYLRVTQSLVHDGDMDLANNLDVEQIKEFHVRDFGVNKASAAPDGKVHSTASDRPLRRPCARLLVGS